MAAHMHLERSSVINKLPRKPSQMALAAILFCIALYGIGFANFNCCRAIVDRCFQASERGKCDTTVAFPYRTAALNQPLQYVSALKQSCCCDPLDACCKAPVNSASIPAALNLFRSPDSSASSGPPYSIAGGLFRPGIFEQKSAQTHGAVLPSKIPLHIQLQSILC